MTAIEKGERNLMWRSGVSIVIVGLMTLVGCAWSVTTNVEHDTELAKEILIAALEAWKSGQVKSLVKRRPPIRFADDDQRAGSKLTDFELDESVEVVTFKNVKVDLVLQDNRGQTVRKTIAYQVGLEPNLTVLRSDN